MYMLRIEVQYFRVIQGLSARDVVINHEGEAGEIYDNTRAQRPCITLKYQTEVYNKFATSLISGCNARALGMPFDSCGCHGQYTCL